MNNETGVKLGSNLLLEEAQQVVAIEDTDSEGTFNAVLTGNSLVITGEFSDLTSDLKITGEVDSEGNPASAIHVHMGIPGENGDIVRNLTVTENEDGSKGFIGTFDLNDSELAAALEDGLYVNLHTEDNPTGELRGQIELDAENQVPLDPRSVQDAAMGGLDLRDIASDKVVEVEFKITREADFDNVGDFYIVDDNGNAVVDPLTGETVAPGAEGYVDAALGTRLGLDLTVDDDQEAMLTRELPGGYNYAPMIVVQGTFDDFADSNPDNPEVYFPYAAANADGGEYIQSMGEMKFGFEDLPMSVREQVNGEPDFNDITFEVFQTGEV